MAQPILGDIAWERMFQAVEDVRDRLERATKVLSVAKIPYAIIGGNAVAAWVGSIDKAAVRTTQDVNVLLRREDLTLAVAAMEAAGFKYRHASGIDMFLDGPDAKARDAVHVIFAGEKVRAEYASAAPQIEEAENIGSVRVLKLESLVRMKLNSFRRKDQMHLTDLLDVGLIDATWLERVPVELAPRLKEIIDNPEG